MPHRPDKSRTAGRPKGQGRPRRVRAAERHALVEAGKPIQPVPTRGAGSGRPKKATAGAPAKPPARRAGIAAAKAARISATSPQNGDKSGAPTKITDPVAAAPAKRPRARKVEAEARRQAILHAALAVFAEYGFEAARLDEVAARAGVAKGTLYLYFAHKEALFEELVRGAVAPVIDRIGALALNPAIPAATVLEAFFGAFEHEVLGTQRKLLLRLIIAEGPRFPAIAKFYHREVVTRGLGLMRALAERAAASGEFTSDAAARFPQLIVAPLLLSVIWDGLFAKIDPLDVNGLLRAHTEVLSAKPGKRTS
jgi:AcrR family transcriptional regulator